MIRNQGNRSRIWSAVGCIFFETATKPKGCEGKTEMVKGEGFGRQECSHLRCYLIDAMAPRDIFEGKINTL